MCTLLKLDYAKFGVSNLFFQSYRRKTFVGGQIDPLPKIQEGLTLFGLGGGQKMPPEGFC